MNDLTTNSLASRLGVAIALLMLLAEPVFGQMTATPFALGITNYQGYIVAGDTGVGGRQAIQIASDIQFAIGNWVATTNVFLLKYQLLDAGGQPVPIADENGRSNAVYTLYQTTPLPGSFGSGPPFNKEQFVFYAPLQPLVPLNYYEQYTPSLQVYSSPWPTNAASVFQLVGQTNGPAEHYLDFTNPTSPDPSPNVEVIMPAPPTILYSWSISNSPDHYGYPVEVSVEVARYDDFTLPPVSTNVAVTLNFQLLNAGTGVPVPLQSTQTVLNVSIPSNDGGTPPNPVIRNLNPVIKVIPAVQLDSVNATYQLVVSLAHTVGTLTVNDYTNTLPATQLLDFNGQFYFGPLLTYFTKLDQPPNLIATNPGTWLECQLDVSANTGIFPQAPGYSYGSGQFLDAYLLPNGSVQLASGIVPINGPTGNQTVQNISFQTFSPTLSTAGASEAVTLTLPTGFSVTPPGSANRLTVGTLSLGSVPLDSTLNPQNVTIPGPIQAVAENLPFWFCGTSLLWNVTNGRLSLALTKGSFVRQTVDDLLTNSQSALLDPTMANRVSNDGYFRNASIVGGQYLSVTADANGTAQLSGYLQLNPPELRPHFPYSGSQDGVQIFIGAIGGNNNGALVLDKGVITSDSFLAFDPGFPAPLIYGRDTQDTNCANSLAGPGTMYFTPTQGGSYGFNADGGLLAGGSVPLTNLTWGFVGGTNYAQEALNVQNGVFEMAGTFLAGGQSAEPPAKLPAVLLFSGFGQGATNPAYVERPGTRVYLAGLASYPGINFTAPANGFSCLGGTTLVSYALAPDAKYYARFGGVSGIHDAANFPSTLPLYNYAFTFSSYRLSFLDSEEYQSLVAGTIVFPSNPSGFTQPFTNMMFSDRGYLESATVPPACGADFLNYWNVSLTPESIEFAPEASDTCGTGPRFLVLGVETQLPLIPQKLHAALGFHPDGNLVTVADNVAGCDSRFAVPAQLSLQSHSGGSFTLATAAEGYFNNYETPGSPAAGFFNLAGKLRVPFFTDIRVHLQVQPLSPTNAQISMMGGWPDPSTSVADEGWDEGAANFFNTAKFDPTCQGFPADEGVSWNDYIGSTSLQYHPIAQRNWIQVATFEYPLQWSSVLGNFTGFQPGTAALPLLTVGSNLKTLIPGKVDMDFAENISLQLPAIKVVDLLNDAAGADGALQSLTTALGSAFDTTGLNELQGLLREDSTALFQPILTNAFSSLSTQIYNSLASLYQSEGGQAAFLPDAVQQIQSCNFTSALNGIPGTPGQANTLAGQIGQTLSDAGGDVNQFVNLLAKDGNGNYPAVQNLVGQLVQGQASVLGPLAGAANSLLGTVESQAGNYGSTLDELHTEFKGVVNQLNQTRGSLTDATSDFAKALAEPLNSSGSSGMITAFETLAARDLTNYLAGALTPQGDFFTANPAAVKQAIQQQLQNAFMNSSLMASYQTTLRQFLFDDNATVGELMDDTFDQMNDAIRDGLTTIISNSDANYGPFNNFTNNTLLSAKIRGSPTFNGDSLRKIHLNASVQMDIPDSMTFNAYMEIKELCSQTVPQDCIPQGDPAAEVTLGAKNVQLDWPALPPMGTPLTLTVAAKWTLQNGNVIGMGGLFDIRGQIGVDGYSLNEIGATLAFGKVENYFAAKVAGTFTVLGVPINANGGIFVGEACSLSPILWIDPQASSTLAANNLNNFSGIYVECGAGLSLSEILFGESSCFLDIGANISGAVYYECTSWPSVSIGMRQTISLDASLLCLISGSASLTMSEIAQCSDFPTSGYSLTLAGDAQVCGSIGPCPFCISGCKNISVVGTVKKGGIDYSVNY